MTTQRDPETILAAWLDEGPTDLPDATRRAIITALPTARQARPFAASRRFSMTIARVATAGVLIAIVAGAAFYLVGQRWGVGAPSPTQTVDRSATAGYAFSVPGTWQVSLETWGVRVSAPPPISSMQVYEGQARTSGPYVIAGGGTFGISGATIAELLAEDDAWYQRVTGVRGANEGPITINGEPGLVTEHALSASGILWIEAVVTHGDRAYNIEMSAPLEHAAELRATFHDILASIRWTR